MPNMFQETLCGVACPKMNILFPQSMRKVEVGAKLAATKNIAEMLISARYTRQRLAQLCLAESLKN